MLPKKSKPELIICSWWARRRFHCIQTTVKTSIQQYLFLKKKTKNYLKKLKKEE